jgi:hypothetical protein
MGLLFGSIIPILLVEPSHQTWIAALDRKAMAVEELRPEEPGCYGLLATSAKAITEFQKQGSGYALAAKGFGYDDSVKMRGTI